MSSEIIIFLEGGSNTALEGRSFAGLSIRMRKGILLTEEVFRKEAGVLLERNGEFDRSGSGKDRKMLCRKRVSRDTLCRRHAA